MVEVLRAVNSTVSRNLLLRRSYCNPEDLGKIACISKPQTSTLSRDLVQSGIRAITIMMEATAGPCSVFFEPASHVQLCDASTNGELS
jgi:hypothetical protein